MYKIYKFLFHFICQKIEKYLKAKRYIKLKVLMIVYILNFEINLGLI